MSYYKCPLTVCRSVEKKYGVLPGAGVINNYNVSVLYFVLGYYKKTGIFVSHCCMCLCFLSLNQSSLFPKQNVNRINKVIPSIDEAH